MELNIVQEDIRANNLNNQNKSPLAEALKMIRKLLDAISQLIMDVENKNGQGVHNERAPINKAINQLKALLSKYGNAFSPSEKDLIKNLAFYGQYFDNIYDNDYKDLAPCAGALFGIALALEEDLDPVLLK